MAAGLSPVQSEILRFLAQHDIGAKPPTIAHNIDYTRNYVSRECKNLTRMGYLAEVEGPFYRITDRGQAYLRGELDEEVDEED